MQTVNYLEDLVVALVTHRIRLASYDHAKVHGMYHQITARNLGLTKRQADLVAKWATVYQRQLSQKEIDVSPVVEDPQTRLEVRTVNPKRSAWIAGNELRFMFPLNDKMVAELHNLRRTMKGAFRATRNKFEYNKDKQRWEVDLNTQNILQCVSFFSRYNFTLTPEVQAFKARIREIQDNPGKYLPVVKRDRRLHNVSEAVQNAAQSVDLNDDQALLSFARAWGLGVHPDLYNEIEDRNGPIVTRLWFHYLMFFNQSKGQALLFRRLEQAGLLPAYVNAKLINVRDFPDNKFFVRSTHQGHVIGLLGKEDKPRCVIHTNEIMKYNQVVDEEDSIDLGIVPVVYYKNASLLRSTCTIERYGYRFSARSADFDYASAARADRGPERLLVEL